MIVTMALLVSIGLNILVCWKTAADRRSSSPTLEQQEEIARALFLWDIRQSRAVLPATDHQLVLATPDTRITYDFDRASGTLTRSTGAESCVLLTNLESASFLFCQRPKTSGQQLRKGANAGLVVLSWKSKDGSGAGTTHSAAACL